MDVNDQAVAAMLLRYDAGILVHGHTHRPAVHDFMINGRPAKRIVLGDWYEQGSVLRWSPAGFELQFLPFL
jgi:UDP-2,3-diacylglucosamine hydrolase